MMTLPLLIGHCELEFWEFDRMLIHEKYQGIVEGLETRKY
jgi:hypothetical protein